ncbi:hypothetical protein [Streptomyces sp. NPDC057781]|uniref:hypothetical protein n=1 Tax=unclassified Streptomyces TaxID=2593676 RepID=UPI00368395FE
MDDFFRALTVDPEPHEQGDWSCDSNHFRNAVPARTNPPPRSLRTSHGEEARSTGSPDRPEGRSSALRKTGDEQVSIGIGLRGAAVAALVAAGSLGMGGTAYAASAGDSSGLPQQRASAGAAQEKRTVEYRGVQGRNFCLLSRCTVAGTDREDASDSDSPVFRGIQGINLCVLAVCRVG